MTDRDLSIDFARAICLPVVVLLHALQMGIEGDPPVAFNALEDWPPLAPVTWIGMIMPIFFIAGGFAGITTWRRVRGAGGTAAEYIRGRTLRLGRPVLLAMLGVVLVLGVLAAFGEDHDFLHTFAFRLAEPLWFIAVYAICTAFVPFMATLHHRSPWRTYVGLAVLALTVDVLSRATPLRVAPLNWLFVWLFVQQLGFGVKDGWFSRRPRWLLSVLALGAYGGIAVGVIWFGYSSDMIDNLNPPTMLLLLLGLAQASLFVLGQPLIRRLMARRSAYLLIGVLGLYGMVIYLWHTVAMAVVVGVEQSLRLPFPAVLTPVWWATRMPWMLAIVAVLAALCVIVPHLERLWPKERTRSMPLWGAVAATSMLVVTVGWVLTQGYLTAGTPIAMTGLALAIVWLTRGGGDRRSEPVGEAEGVRSAP